MTSKKFMKEVSKVKIRTQRIKNFQKKNNNNNNNKQIIFKKSDSPNSKPP